MFNLMTTFKAVEAKIVRAYVYVKNRFSTITTDFAELSKAKRIVLKSKYFNN